MDQSRARLTENPRRAPLSERQPRASMLTESAQSSQPPKPALPSPIPHHESRHPEGNLSIINRPSAPSPRAAHNRTFAIAQDEHVSPHKRDSQISNASTISTNKAKRKTHIGPWQLGRTLGKGATGRVRLAKHALTGQTAAIKIVSKKAAAMVQSASMAQMDQDASLSTNIAGNRSMPFGIEREIVIMKLINHPNITSLYDVWENRGELYLVLEFVEGGELFDYVLRNGALPEHEAIRLFRQLIAGLAYCHRFNICHRDLKPENLLLDRDHNLKIADFGMAAMQPAGKSLTTSCGSPHYAAPEIIASKKYKGSQADVWSVGIILYAMLNGFLPFDGKDLPSTLALVRRGKYYLPPTLSDEATNMIQRILQLDPDARITVAEMWTHPLLTKYEALHKTRAPKGQFAGPPLPLSAAGHGNLQLKLSDIDRELLRNLQVLWHGLDEQEVVRRLVSPEPNHEQLFYQALLRFREEQLENFTGDPLQYSLSDYHHVRKSAVRLTRSSTKSALHQRRHSQFSIVSGESLLREGYYKNPRTAASKTTQASYDPYRASRTPIAQPQKQGTKVIVKRPGSYPSGPQLSSSSRAHDCDTHASTSTPDVPCIDSTALRKLIDQKRSTYSTVSSRSSLASSLRQRVFRKSTSYRRTVAFHHQRRRSTRNVGNTRDNSPQSATSNVAGAGGGVENECPYNPRPQKLRVPELVKTQRPPTSSYYTAGKLPVETPFKDVTRKASAELGKMCEDAFNRSSVSYASELSQQLPADSPATTVSAPGVTSAQNGGATPEAAFTPTLRDLMERRKKIIETWGEADPQTLAALINTLDQRINEEQLRADIAAERRAVSDPTNGRFVTASGSTAKETKVKLNQRHGSDVRSVSDPLKGQDNTIRMVTPDAASPISRLVSRPSKAMPLNSLKGNTNLLDSVQAHGIHDKHHFNKQTLKPILEDPPSSPRKQTPQDNRKWSWLGRKGTASSEDLAPTPPRKDTPKDKYQRTVSSLSGTSSDPKEVATTEETEARKRRWFQKVFSKRRQDSAPITDDHMVVQNDFADTDTIDGTATPARRGRIRGHHVMPSIESVPVSSTLSRPEISQNWFAKFLHLKPATSVMVLNLSKAGARREIVKILREWRKFGIRDVEVEKSATGDMIRARVDTANYLHIRPVQFFANVYTILEKGTKAQMAVVKFTQEKGAASSFHRVVDTLESVLKENDLILSNLDKKKIIIKSMKQAGL